MKEFKVLIPEEDYSILNFRQEDLPGVAVVNISLRDFEPKEVFAWHLSIMVELNDLGENGMPTKSKVHAIENYGDFLDDRIKGATSVIGHKPSTTQDLNAGKPLEIDPIIGSIIEIANKLKVETPNLKKINSDLKLKAENLGLYQRSKLIDDLTS